MRRAGPQRRGRHRGGRRGRGGARRQAVPLATSRGRWLDWDCADQRVLRHDRAREPPARLRRPRRSSRCCRHRLGAGAAPDFGTGHGHRAGPHRGPPDRRDRQQPDAPGRRHRRRRRRQGRPLHAAVRRLRHPVLSLCDTPGIMVGPEAEKTALVRHCCRMFVVGANLTVPFFTVVLRKAYGLGAQAMARRQLTRRRCSRCPGRRASSAAWAWKVQ